jgi:hypothetical protein
MILELILAEAMEIVKLHLETHKKLSITFTETLSFASRKMLSQTLVLRCLMKDSSGTAVLIFSSKTLSLQTVSKQS